jgi:GNAT superfamily N-acetyltransferase
MRRAPSRESAIPNTDAMSENSVSDRAKGHREFPAIITSLAMTARPPGPPPPRPLAKTAIFRAECPPVHFYRYLYDTIGRDYLWIERRLWDDATLAALLEDEKVALYVLLIGGVPAGMAELDFRQAHVAQIAYFGLMPEFVGRRIGPWFLHQAIELAWAEPIGTLQVNTCTLDHRKALSTYQRAGFTPYGRSERTIVAPPDFPLPARFR